MTDETLFTSPNEWLKIKKSEHGFYYAERKGINSVAVFLVRHDNDGEWEVLLRHQPLPITPNLQTWSCPITGCIDEKSKDPKDTAIIEALEEGGFVVTLDEMKFLCSYKVGTQTNEEVLCYWANVEDKEQTDPKGDGSFHESMSKSHWHKLEEIKDFSYSACMIGYLALKEFLK